MRREIAVAAIVTSILGTPVQAQRVRSEVSSIVETINRDGFAKFAAIGADDSDVAESPVLTWYVHRFLTLSVPDPQARAFVEQLREAGVTVGGTVRATRGRSGYTQAVASYEREDLGVDTHWDLPPAATRAWTADIDIHTTDRRAHVWPPGAVEAYVRAPFYERDGIRAVRLDSADGSRALFVFFADSAALTNLRMRMSPALWESIARDFTESTVVTSDFSVDLQKDIGFPADADEGFGSFKVPLASHHAGTGELAISASLNQIRIGLRGTMEGLPTVHAPGAPDLIGRTTHADPSFPTPVVHRLSTTVPLLYVVQDTRSGAILLLGEHA